MTKQIQLTNSDKVVLVDDEDYDFLMQWKWHFDGYYARRQTHIGMIDGKQKQKPIRLHIQIMNPPEGMDTDHINGDRLDNRRTNLRLCTTQENNRNRGLGKKGYKGVYFHKVNKKWIAQIRLNNKGRHLGSFENINDALLAYNKAAIEHFGEFAKINIISD